MPIEPVKIPQNVHIEDRIIGPLTLRQIIISMLGVGFSYAIWGSIQKVYGYVPLHITVIVWIPAALALIFSFVKVNDLSMTHILFLLLERIQKPQTRVWGPRRGLTVNVRSFAQPHDAHRKVGTRSEPGSELGDLTTLLDKDPAEGESEAQQPVTPEVQGSTLPPRPVQPGRVSVSPLLMNDLEDVHNESGQPVMKDILHPDTSHA